MKTHNYQQFIQELQIKLQQSPLPGVVAQRQMAPSSRLVQEHNLCPSNYNEGGVLILLYPRENQVHFVLILRPNYQGAHSGQISLPGGKKEREDRDLAETALRETHEEIAVTPEGVRLLGKLSSLYIPTSNCLVSPFVGVLTHTPFFQPNHEVAEIFEVPLALICTPERIKTKHLYIKSQKVRAPYYDIHRQTVWGATAMILSEFASVLSGSLSGHLSQKE